MEIINKKELAAAEEEAAASTTTYIHKFATPWTYEGKTYEQLTFEWGKLTGADSLAIENEIQALGKPLIAPEFSGDFLIRMAARACTDKIGADMLTAMPLVDYNRIRNRARSFLLMSGL